MMVKPNGLSDGVFSFSCVDHGRRARAWLLFRREQVQRTLHRPDRFVSCREHGVVLLSSISFVFNDLNPSTAQDRLGNAIERLEALERLERLSVLWCRSSTEEELTTQLDSTEKVWFQKSGKNISLTEAL
jgi:hypothetical protein